MKKKIVGRPHKPSSREGRRGRVDINGPMASRALWVRVPHLLQPSLPAERLRDGFSGERSHHVVTGVVWEESVDGQLLLEIAAFGQRGIVVEIHRTAAGGIVLEPAVHSDDFALG